MKNLIKSIKKLHPKKGDILIIHAKGIFTFSDASKQAIREVLDELGENIPCLLLEEDNIKYTFQKLTQGKHKVYLNNLEYLEWLHNKKTYDRLK